MSSRGISAAGAYIPELRMSREAIALAHAWAMPGLRGLAKGSRAFASWDEDTITMGVEALRNCMRQQPEAVSSLIFASTTAPFDDYQNATSVAAAVGIAGELRATDVAGSLRCATSALITALESRCGGSSVVVAADCRLAKPGSPQEMHYGAGSVALAVSERNMIARLLGSYSVAAQFVDHYRPKGERFDYYWEDRWIRDEGYMKIVPQTVKGLLAKTGIAADTISHFCMPGTLPKLAAGLAKQLGIAGDAVVDNLAAPVGDTGAPHPLLMLMKALEVAKPGDRILVVGFGAGCDAILLEATDEIAAYQAQSDLSRYIEGGRVSESYNQLLSFSGQLELEWGMRAEVDNKVAVSQLYRSQEQVTGFCAGQCGGCGAVQFPVLSTCVKCGATDAMSPVPLADEPARVATYSTDNLQYYPAPPMYWGLVQFDNGARLLMEMVGVDAGHFDVGTALRMTYRIKQKDERRGLHRYFWKATPAQ